MIHFLPQQLPLVNLTRVCLKLNPSRRSSKETNKKCSGLQRFVAVESKQH